MKVLLDTNVFISGVFFGGPPRKILEAWRDDKIQLLLSAVILEEYQRVLSDLAVTFPGIEVEALLEFLILHSEIVIPTPLQPVIQADPSDNKFLECAVAGKATCIISGDKHLLKLHEFNGIPILKPREFWETYLVKE